MTFEETHNARVSTMDAIHECKRHGIVADYEGNELFDCTTGETIAWAGNDGEYNARTILEWLGY